MGVTRTAIGAELTASQILKVSMYFWLNNQIAINTTFWRTAINTGPGFYAGDVAVSFQTRFSPLYSPIVAAPALFLGTRAQQLNPGSPPLAAGVASDTAVGADTGGPLPTQTCGLVSFYGNAVGRTGRGRIYIPFPAISSQDPATGIPTAAYANALLPLAAGFLLPLVVTGSLGATTDLTQYLYSRAGGASRAVYSAVARNYWCTQRRRSDIGRMNRPIIPL